jgi:hypothetical protein
MRELKSSEIEQVDGAVLNLVFGAVVGATGYLASQAISGNEITLGGFATSTAVGAVTGGLGVIANGGRLAGATAFGVAKSAQGGAAVGLVGGAAVGAAS